MMPTDPTYSIIYPFDRPICFIYHVNRHTDHTSNIIYTFDGPTHFSNGLVCPLDRSSDAS